LVKYSPIKKIEIERKVDLLEAIGTEEFTKRSRELYGFPNGEVIQKARGILLSKPKSFAKEKTTLDSENAKKEFEKAFQEYGLKKWKVVFKDDLAADALAGKRNTLFVRTGAVFAPERLQATIAHEVATHILRAENGKKQPYEIFSRGLANYLETEEGLAIYNQNLVLDEKSEKHYWPVVSLLAVEYAEEHSFREVYDFVRKFGFDKERAWKTALKVKRGLRDTSESGGFTKEHIYFSGLQKVEKFVEEGGAAQRAFCWQDNFG
jgi:hypothetical protein